MAPTKPLGKFTVSADEIYFVPTSITEEGGNRIVEREMPYVDGADCDDTGAKAERWTVEMDFDNSLIDEGLPEGITLYNDELNKLLRAFSIHEVGDLQLPTRGVVRARASTYTYTENDQLLEHAKVRAVFVRDNEQRVNAGLLGMATTRSTMKTRADETVFSLSQLGSISEFVEQFEDACSALSDAIAAPGEMVQDVDQKVAAVVRAVENVERQIIISTGFYTERLSDPESWAAWNQMRNVSDLACRALADKTSGVGKVVSIVTDLATTIFSVATKYAQDPQQLMDLNSDVEDFLVIPAKTVLRIFDR